MHRSNVKTKLDPLEDLQLVLLVATLVEFQKLQIITCFTKVKKLKFYVKDTINFIKEIEAINHVSDGSYIVSLDNRSLYTNIPHEEGIEAVK